MTLARQSARWRPSELLLPTPAGLYCPPADIHIDPVRPVARALITHGHSDHARAGHGAVLATTETLAIMALRYGEGFAGSQQVAVPGEAIRIGEVDFTFVPAGHVLGSAQIAVESRGLRIVASGDYKRERDPTCTGFEPVPCDVFITEATFGLPVFRHPPDEVPRIGHVGNYLTERQYEVVPKAGLAKEADSVVVLERHTTPVETSPCDSDHPLGGVDQGYVGVSSDERFSFQPTAGA